MDRSRDWSVRIAHEASLHEESSFLTLTYSDEALPADRSLDISHLQKFMKRLRKAIAPSRVRFFACGEYGDQTWRPHYHVILFGYGFPDRVPVAKAKSGALLYESAVLSQTWGLGIANIGAVTRESGAYVARYCLKKITGPPAEEHYRWVDQDGVVHELDPEFACMSSKPGIGAWWFERYEGDAFPKDFVTVDGRKFPVPRYYRRKLVDRYESGGDADALLDESDYGKLKRRLRARMDDRWKEHSTDERLAVRESIAEIRQAKIAREG